MKNTLFITRRLLALIISFGYITLGTIYLFADMLKGLEPDTYLFIKGISIVSIILGMFIFPYKVKEIIHNTKLLLFLGVLAGLSAIGAILLVNYVAQ